LAEFTHFVTRVKVVPAVADDVSLSEAERTRGRDFATKLSMRVLSRTWQMLLKGISEVQVSGRPVAAAEMVLVRLAYAADLPTPDEVIRTLGEGGSVSVPASAPQGNGGGGVQASASSAAPRYDAPRGAPRASAAVSPRPAADPIADQAPTRALNTFADVVALAVEQRDINMKLALERDVRLVRCEDGQLEVALEQSAAKGLVHELQRKLTDWTGKRWIVVVSKEQGEPTLRAQAEAQDAEIKRGVAADPLVQAVMNRFPGATIVGVTQPPPAEAEEVIAPPPEEDED
ncbi:MAG: DNA polymerase III subunit gamma/tau, partial [Pseudolabrys sp.]